MRVLVCGGREYNDKDKVFKTLDDLCLEFNLKGPEDEYGNWLPGPITIIHGAARGADDLADQWAVVNWVQFEEYPADWNTHGKSAGAIRNQRMLKEGRPDLVIAFPGGKGTAHMVSIAKEAGIPVREIA